MQSRKGKWTVAIAMLLIGLIVGSAATYTLAGTKTAAPPVTPRVTEYTIGNIL